MSKALKLINGLETIVDDDVYEWAIKYRWRSMPTMHVRRSLKGGSTIPLHREILNAPRDKFVDHINGNPLDNRRENLRVATSRENQLNQHARRGLSKYRGVTLHRATGKWWARISVSKQKRKSLGLFFTELEAAQAYDAAAKVLHGEFANLNLKDS